MEVDLHTHSTASDGTLSPSELIHEAKRIGLKAIALTDHDTTQGLEEAYLASQKYDLEFIPGCELSVQFKGMTHILGLWLQRDAPVLNDAFVFLQKKRKQRNVLIIEKLNRLGIDITYAEVQKKAKGTIGRPHIAQVLTEKKVTRSVQEAFEVFLNNKGKAYVPKEKFSPEQAIKLLKQEQATVILAHPFSLNLSPLDLEKELIYLKELGLDGIEAFYSEHSPELTQTYLHLAQKLDLQVSGGSDFHGQNKPHIKLGVGKNNLNLSYVLVQRLKEYRAKQGLWV